MSEDVIRIGLNLCTVEVRGRELTLVENSAREEHRFRRACDHYAVASLVATVTRMWPAADEVQQSRVARARQDAERAKLQLVRSMLGEDVDPAWAAGLAWDDVGHLVEIQQSLGWPPLDIEAARAELERISADNAAEVAATGALSGGSQVHAFRLLLRIDRELAVREQKETHP